MVGIGGVFPSFTYPELMFDGDSITAGFGTLGSPASKWINLLLPRTWEVRNAAINGQTAADCLNLAPIHVDSFLLKSAPLSVSIVWAGTNDLQHGVSPADVWTTLSQYSADRKLAGWNLTFVMTCVSRFNVSDVTRATFNDIIRSSWPGVFDGIIDVAETSLGVNGSCNDTVLFLADKIHPTVLSQRTIIAPLEASIINTLIF